MCDLYIFIFIFLVSFVQESDQFKWFLGEFSIIPLKLCCKSEIVSYAE